VFIFVVVVVYFVVDSVRKLLDTPSYVVPCHNGVLDRWIAYGEDDL